VRRIIGWGIIAAVLLIGLGYLWMAWMEYNNRPIAHLIPEGTKGWCYILWDDPNASPLIETKNERILHFSEKGIARTSYSPDGGYYVGYYYVDQNGKRTEIPDITDFNPDPKASILTYIAGSYWVHLENGLMYPAVAQFFLGTREEIKEEFKRDPESDSYPEEVLDFVKRYEKWKEHKPHH
jgi:hypothetical protein